MEILEKFKSYLEEKYDTTENQIMILFIPTKIIDIF